MPTTFFPIVARHKDNELFFASAADFTTGQPEATDAYRLLHEPGWSPYCLDAEAGRLVFVRLPPGIDLTVSPFYFVTQFRDANAMLTMSLDDPAQFAAGLPDPRVIFVFSIGRCGTTLISHALNGSPDVSSLSEPEVFNHRQLRPLGDRAPALIRDLLRLLFASRAKREATTLAIKLRSQALFVADRFLSARADARSVFMYRDAVSWSESFTQFLLDLGVAMPLDAPARDLVWSIISAEQPIEVMRRYVDTAIDPVDPAIAVPAGWLVQMEKYLDLFAAGAPFLALRYNELVADRAGELTRLFRHCDLPVGAVTQALTAFDEDSQKGTSIGRGATHIRFDAEAVARVRQTLARRPRVADPDLILPDLYSR